MVRFSVANCWANSVEGPAIAREKEQEETIHGAMKDASTKLHTTAKCPCRGKSEQFIHFEFLD